MLLQSASVHECIIVSGQGSGLLSIGFLLPLLDPSSYLQFECQGPVFLTPDARLKTKQQSEKSVLLGFLSERHCNPKSAILLPVSSCEDVGGEEPGLWLEVKVPHMAM